MGKFQKQDFEPLRGFKDIWGEDYLKYNLIVDTAKRIAHNYGFENIIPPIAEKVSIFERNIGQETDAVSKELYRFEDRGGDMMALRPEFTACIARAVIHESSKISGHSHKGPLRLFSYGPLFRYDRPQQGRYRQFNQINFEVFKDSSPLCDIYMINMAFEILTKTITSKAIKIHINSLGSKETKEKYANMVQSYFALHKDNLSADSLRRLEANPLRILDSKEECDKALFHECPSIVQARTQEENTRLHFILQTLQYSHPNITIIEDTQLVRGLDYYSSTIFEIIDNTTGLTILGGGRYDNMIEDMSYGKYKACAFGFAAGVERLMLLTDLQQHKISEPLKVAVIMQKYSQHDILNTYNTIMAGVLKNNPDAQIVLLSEDNLSKNIDIATKNNYHYIINPCDDTTLSVNTQMFIKCLTTKTQFNIPSKEVLFTSCELFDINPETLEKNLNKYNIDHTKHTNI